jgi:DNA mismatch repair protein MutS
MTENLIYNEYFKAQQELEERYGSNSIVLMMVGSFYEIYSVDLQNTESSLKIGKAEEAHNILGMNITKKNKSKEHAINNPFMVGFPDYALDEHLGKLLRANMTVAIYDQFDSKKNGRACKIRKLTHTYTPSTFIDDTKTDDNSLLSFELTELEKSPRSKKKLKKIHVAVLCLNTGKVYLLEAYDTPTDNGKAESELYRIIHSYNPSEIICTDVDTPTNRNKIEKYYDLGMKKLYFRQLLKEYTKTSYQDEFLRKIYGNCEKNISMIDYLNLERHTSIIPQFIQALQFAYEQDKLIVSRIQKPEFIQPNSHLILNDDSLYQLNLVESPFDMSKTLFNVICKSKTPMGKRLLKQSLLSPLNSPDEINERYDLIEQLIDNYEEYGTILRGIVDIEKKFRKMVLHTLHPYEFADMETSFKAIKILLKKGKDVFKIPNELVKQYKEFYNEYTTTFDFNILKRCKLKDIKGSFFLTGVNQELDNIDKQINLGKQVLNTIANEFSKYVKTQGKTDVVKLESTDKEGWYLNITKTRFNTLPKNLKFDIEYNNTKYTIKYDELDTTKLTNTIKIHCPLIRKISSDIIFLKNKLNDVLIEEYIKLLDHYTKDYENVFVQVAQIIGKIDFIYSAAKTACEYGYTRPIITDKLNSSSYLIAKEIRHPIIERINENEEYITNDISLGINEHYGSILYGLNMSGKTSLMRSIGCNIVMAQAGLYVSCTELEYYPFNNILSKLTIRDNMSKGQSTFMVEMLEVKNMLMRADPNTLVLSDELCSSTESTSGHSIVAQTLHELSNKKAKFIFSTHLHDLQKIPLLTENKHIKIWHFKVHIKNDKIIFDRHIELGGMTDLYGLEVAKALGLPDDFMRGAFSVRDYLVKQPSEILSTKKSRYNSNVFVHSCSNCGSCENLHTHHINHQEDADKNGMINNKFHKNSKFNLQILCKKCHQELHSKEKLI